MRKILLTLVALAATFTPIAVATAPAEATTLAQRQAIGSAHDYLRAMPFSRAGLIHQLHSPYGEGFSLRVSTYAVDHITVSWRYQAYRSARSYLRIMHFSRAGLIHQLESYYGERFTHWQAVYGVNRVGL
jgi:hypothetical protein